MISHNSIPSPSFVASKHREAVPAHDYNEDSQICTGYEQDNLSLLSWSFLPQIDALDYSYSNVGNETGSHQLYSADPICSLTTSNQFSVFFSAETQGESLCLDDYRSYTTEPAVLSELNQTPSEGVDYEGGPSKTLDKFEPQSQGPSQPPTTPEASLDTVCDAPENTPLYHDFLCANNCDGNFVGLHECFRNKKSLIISCSGSRSCSSTFRTRHEFTRHYNVMHMHEIVGSKRLLDCPVAGCVRVGEKGFTRKDNMLQHRRGFHGEDIPKKCMRFGRKSPFHRQLRVAKIFTGKRVKRR